MSACRLGVAAATLVLAACAPVPQKPVDSTPAAPLVFPLPPEEPRFVFERAVYTSADVVPEDDEGRLRRLVTGDVRRATALAKPYAVAVHRGRIFLSDSVERFVKVFDVPQGRFFTIGTDGQGQLVKPLGLDVDGAGNLYVADVTARSIKAYSRDGLFLRAIGGPKWFDRPASVTVDAQGERVYAVDIGGGTSQNHRG